MWLKKKKSLCAQEPLIFSSSQQQQQQHPNGSALYLHLKRSVWHSRGKTSSCLQTPHRADWNRLFLWMPPKSSSNKRSIRIIVWQPRGTNSTAGENNRETVLQAANSTGSWWGSRFSVRTRSHWLIYRESKPSTLCILLVLPTAPHVLAI